MSWTESKGSRARRVPVLAVLPWALLALGALATIFLPGPVDGFAIRTALVVTSAALFAALLLRIGRTALAEPGRRVSLTFLGGAVLLWATGSATVSVGQTVTAVTFPAPGEILCVAAYVGMAGFVLLDVPGRVRAALHAWLEAAVVCGTAVCLAALVVLTPLTGTFIRDGFPLLVAIGFPLVNLVMFAIVLGQAMLQLRERSPRTVALLGGFLGLALADSTFIERLSAQAYGANLAIEALWGASFSLLVGAACTTPRPAGVSVRPERRPVMLVVASALAVVVLTLHPAGAIGAGIRAVAVSTVAIAGFRMWLALREAQAAAEALRLSVTDDLTGLPNRRGLLSAVDAQLAEARAFTLLLLDLDRFKDVNDSLGHAVGDQVLGALARRLRGGLAPRVLVARLGGDEFAALLPGEPDELVAAELAETARMIISAPLDVEGMQLSLESSVGVVVTLPGQVSSTEVLRRADIAMYQAKRDRTGLALFDPSLDGTARERLERGEALRAAITADELTVVYQPQVDALTREVVAVEALVRWVHPEHGVQAPLTFLGDARTFGLMPALTSVVMRHVVEDARRWLDAGFAFRVAMNCAPPELVSPTFAPELAAVLERASLPADRLIVEITEDSFLADPERAVAAITGLARHGIQISVDDYGTGFSSLAYLRDLPVHELKLDRTFITDVATDDRSRLLVHTTAQMAGALGLRLVAEGVEDADAAERLVPLGVDVLQGYHIARPMPAVEVGPWVRWWTQGRTSVSADKTERESA